MDGADFSRLREALPAMQAALAELRLDGWLLYDLRARNAIAAKLLGVGELTRRTFVLIPARGEPYAVMHGIERAPWAAWPWRSRSYVGWAELDRSLAEVLAGLSVVAMEVSPLDAVPSLDLVPAGVKERVESAGVTVASSGELVTRFYSRWSADGLASHRRAATVLAEVAAAAFDALAGAISAGAEPTEGWSRRWILERLEARGLCVGADAIVAVGENAADPHYQPRGNGAFMRAGMTVLIDLWGKESEGSVYADQTWMAFLGVEVPERVAALWAAVRDARDAAVAFLRAEWRAGRTPCGYEVDDVTRGALAARHLGGHFIHRTGHSIDEALHGAGPNLDNFETREMRRLIPGVGFSIEPGIYVPGEIGLRSEINVYMGDGGPEVTTPRPQDAMPALLQRP